MRYNNLYKVLIFISILFFSKQLKGQYYLWGDDPSSIKWNQIKGETYKLIYPRGEDSLAIKYLWLLEENKKAVMLGLDAINPAKIPVVLHSNTARSNGFVVWAPKRMELYTLPPINSYSQNWAEQLAIHESRHLGQMTFYTKGIFKLGSYIIGQHAAGIAVALYPASWMLEGDAVVAETELTNSGRGRSATFLEYYRSSFLQNQYRNVNKWKFGSLKYYSPDMYAFGYLINSTIRYRTGNYNFQGKIFDGYVKDFYNFSVNTKYYKKETGYGYTENFTIGQKIMDSLWREDYNLRGRFSKGTDLVKKKSNYYTEYNYPIKIGKDSILYIKWSYDQAAKLVLVTNGKTYNQRVFSSTAKGFNSFGDNIYFTDNLPDSRWSNESYSLLYSYNWREKKLKQLSKKSFYNSPAISPKGDKISVTEYLKQGGSKLLILNAKNANIEYECNAPDNGQITTTTWQGDYIYAIVITNKGLGIFRKNINISRLDDDWERIVNEQNANIYDLRSSKDFIYFVSDMDGVNNIYKIDIASLKLDRLSNSEYGATSAYIYDNELYYSSLNTNGKFPQKYNLGTLPKFNTKYNIKLKNGELLNKHKYIVAETLTAQAKKALKENNLLAPDSVIKNRNNTSIVKYTTTIDEFAKTITPKKYNKLTHLFRVHSWLPFYADIDGIMNESFANIYTETALGATLVSQNTLGTAISMFGYSYKKGYHAGHINFKYSGLYPIFKIDAHINNGMRNSFKVVNEKNKSTLTIDTLTQPLFETDVTCYVPINLSSRGWRRALIPQAKWSFENNQFYSKESDKFFNKQTIIAGLQYYQLFPVPKAGIFPQWGFGAIVKGAFSPNNQNSFSKVGSLYAYGYLPGFDVKHGFKLSGSYQKQFLEGKTYLIGNLISGPRGHNKSFFGEEMLMGGIDYAAPIYLGDFNLWWLAYVQRLQLIPFADYGVCKSKVGYDYVSEKLYSVGATAMVDCFLVGYRVPFSLGLRYSYNGASFRKVQKNRVEFMINISGF